jgi:hypothetical protein
MRKWFFCRQMNKEQDKTKDLMGYLLLEGTSKRGKF